MSNSTLYIGNLSYSVEEGELEELFSEFGKVISVKSFKDKGFCFLEMSSAEEASKALEKLNNQEFLGRPMKIDFARPKKETYPDRYKD